MRYRFDWSPEQLEIIDTFGKENRWKFHFETVVEYSMTQNQLHEKCQQLVRLGYRVDQIIGI